MLCSMAACARAMKLPPVPINAKRLILVRHGSVDRAAHDPPIPDGALYGGNLEVPLSAKGEEEAAAAADLIGEFALEHAPDAISLIASSPMKRAMYGAERIREAVSPHRIGGVGIQSYELFKEIDRGEWVNLTREQIEEKWGKDAFDRSVLEPEYGRTFGGEGMGDLTERVLTARDHVLRGVRDGSAAVIVSHMWVTRAMVADAIGETNYMKVDIPTASISVIDYGPESWPPSLATEPAQVPIIGYKPKLASAEASAAEQQAQ